MKYQFLARSYPEALALTTPAERAEICKIAVANAEKLKLKGNDFVIFDVDNGLKVCVAWEARTVHIMTAAEANIAGLPKKGEQN